MGGDTDPTQPMKARMARAYRHAGAWLARWDVRAALAFTVVSLALYAVSPTSQVPSSDGHYSWAYARSLAYDGDFDFGNDYAVCGDPFAIGWQTPAHRPANIFYFGPAVFWTPFIWILKHFVHGDARTAAGCAGPIPTIVLTLSSIAGGVLVLTLCALLRRIVGPRLAALTALLTTLGGHVLYFTALNPSYSHVYDAMCVALYLYVLLRMREVPERAESLKFLMLAGFLLGLAILQRASNAIFSVVAVGALLRSVSREELQRSARSLSVVAGVSLMTGIAPLLAINRAIFGRPTLYAHGPHFLHLAHAHPWLLLFDERGGLFTWAPVMWVAVPGLVLLVRRRDLRWLVLPLLVCCAFELYLSSAALDYQGARRLLNLTPLGALSMALVLQRVARWLVARPARLAIAAALGLLFAVGWGNAAVCIGFAQGKLPWDRPLTSSERFGEGEKQTMAATENLIGSLDTLPAGWIFALRYHLSPLAFGWAAHPQWYMRDMRTLDYQRSDFSFTAPEARALLRGFHVDDKNTSACMTGHSAAAVFSAQWPFAARARLTYDAARPGSLSVASRTFFGFTTRWDTAELRQGKGNRALLRIPPGGFDSGINELDFKFDGDPAGVCLHAIEFVDDASYPAAPEAEASPPIMLWHGEEVRPDSTALPSVAVGSTPAGPWLVEVNEVSGGQIGCSWGRPGEYSAPTTLPHHGNRPRVVAGDADLVLEVEQGQSGAGALWSRTGRVSGAQNGVAWSERTQFGSGYHPAIGASRGQLVEVQMSDPGNAMMSFRTARYGTDGIHWNDTRGFDARGFDPAVAVAPWPGGAPSSFVLEVHQEKASFGPMWMRTGKLDAKGDVEWRDPIQYDSGVFPSVTVFGRTVVELHQGQDDGGSLWMKVGTIDADGFVHWQSTRNYDNGAHPVIASDAASGKAVEAHEGKLGFGPMWSRAGEVY